jgi:hypothetical protein
MNCAKNGLNAVGSQHDLKIDYNVKILAVSDFYEIHHFQ